MQRIWVYAIVAFIIGVVVGTGIGWFAKPIPVPVELEERISKLEGELASTRELESKKGELASSLKEIENLRSTKAEGEAKISELFLSNEVLDYMIQTNAHEELLPEESPRDIAFTAGDIAEVLAKYYDREVETEDVKTALRILCLLPTKPPRPPEETAQEKKN